MTKQAYKIPAEVILFAILWCTSLFFALLNPAKNIHTCSICGKQTLCAYYDAEGSRDSVLCTNCAVRYWMPLNYKDYRVSYTLE